MRSTTKSFLSLAAASALLCGAPLYAQTTAGTYGSQSGTSQTNSQPGSRSATSGNRGHAQASADNTGSSATASASDKTFVREALAGDLGEIQVGQMAAQKGASEGVKDFGQKLVTDHTKLKDQMTPVAEQLGITPPTEPLAKQQAVAKRLEGLSGEQFDREFIKAMVTDHREDVQKFKKEETSAKSSAVKDAATQGEPVIAEHLKIAEDLQKNPNATQISSK
jgi:putative membrane protein